MFATACGGSDATDDASANADSEPVTAIATAEPEPEPTESPQPEPTAEPEPAPTQAPEPAADPEPDAEDELSEEDVSQLPLAAETIDWSDCRGLQCGTVDVPLDYSGESEGTLAIAVNVLRSTSLDDRVGYLLVNPGGPGVSGTSFAENMASFPDELLDAFDIVGFDPRGVGDSEPRFGCGVDTEQFDLLQTIDELPDTPEEIAIGNQAAQLCVETMGPAGRLLHSAYVARDMDEIRKALGADQISYLGFSYGSSLGGWYASLFPDSVRSMVLDGAGNPLAPVDTAEQREQALRDTIGPLHEAFERALASCDSADCPIYNAGDPVGFYNDAIDNIDLLVDASAGDWQVVIPAINGGLYSETSWPRLHNAIAALASGDPAGMVELAEVSGAVGGQAASVSHINCLDGQVLFPEQDLDYSIRILEEELDQLEALLTADYPLFAAALSKAPIQLAACTFYDSIEPPAFEATFDGGGIPILVIGNGKDQVTPLVQSEQYANDVLSDGRLVITDHFAHTVYPSNNCINDFVHAALIDLDYPEDEPTCPEQTLADASSGVDPNAEVALVPVEFPDGASTVRPEDWAQIDEGVYVRDDANPLGTLFVAIPTEGDREAALDIVRQNIGGADLEPGPPQEFDGVNWDTYEAQIDGANLAVRVGITDGDGGIMFLLQSTKEDLDGLTESVLIPALQAFEPAP